ncbi:hypothetical protein N7532_004544 [Penicillium argentinense]|uniref:RNA polymerase II holoenzyme cyclin-like subunit n=1 Tax=Penicillium argentinense TaxID=1131581 RepID=A0A9W9FQ53_9EURO|nr:uncharacterized protein N7532_004544 [Penicillium argentinense]KAJ5104015.1 hypothetical protein N7532_004544 [Penicillium argentinense]
MAESSESPAPQRRRIPGLPNPVLAAAQEKWIFTDEELDLTPSRFDKIERETEDYLRHRSVEFIWQVSLMLRLSSQTSMTATVLMHRFLMRYSLRGHFGPEKAPDHMHPKVIAAVALFVAFKVDEDIRRMKDFVIACCRVAMKQPKMVVDEQSKDYWRWRDLILQNESVMLEFLCFDLQLQSPYRVLSEYISFFGIQDNRPLRNAAFAFLNDSTYTVLCLQYPPRVMAAAALYAAARHSQVAFPDDSQGRPWWEHIDVRVEDLIKACKIIVKIYERVQQNLSKGYPVFTFSDSDPTDPTRLFNSNPASSSFELTPTPSLTTPAGDPGSPNGRKRSREPDSNPPDVKQGTPALTSQSLDAERSPKRQRTISPAPGTTPAEQREPQAQAQASAPPRPRIPRQAMATNKPHKPAYARPGPDTERETPASSNKSYTPNGRDHSHEPEHRPQDLKQITPAQPSQPLDTERSPNGQHTATPVLDPPKDEGGGSEEGEV